MNLINAQFSIKFSDSINVRRRANDIEDALAEHYGNLQILPIPDNFAAEAPRVILTSKNGHSSVAISLISVDLNVNFDGNFVNAFDKTREYVTNRAQMLVDLLSKLGVKGYCYCGVIYNFTIDAKEPPVEYMGKLLGGFGKVDGGDIYDALWRKTVTRGDLFINEQVGIDKHFDGVDVPIPELVDFANNRAVDERIVTTLDINNRFRYLQSGNTNSLEEFSLSIDSVYSLMDEMYSKWSKEE